MQKLQFSVNDPVIVTLHSIEGAERASNFGTGTDHMFTADEGVFYVSEKAGKVITDQLRKLGVKPGEPAEICKAVIDAGRGRTSTQWIVSYPVSDAAEPAAPAQPAPAPAPAATPRKPVAVAPAAASAGPARPHWADVLIAQTTVVVDCYAAILAHASEAHGNAVRPEDVRTLMTTVFINLAKSGVQESSRNAA